MLIFGNTVVCPEKKSAILTRLQNSELSGFCTFHTNLLRLNTRSCELVLRVSRCQASVLFRTLSVLAHMQRLPEMFIAAINDI